jgi:hypothetical protein
MMTNIELANKLRDIARNYKTLYVMGCFGAPMTASNKKRYTQNHSYNRQAARTAMIYAASADTFGFDCVCLIKGVLWGWKGDKNAIYGGASYACNGVPDIGADTMITVCKNISTDFSKIEVGEAVWMEGHIGVYVGDGLAVECTPRWDNKVQITACNRSVSGYNRRNWTKHGRLPYVTYVQQTAPSEPSEPAVPASSFKKGDLVKITGEKYYSGKTIPKWVKAKNWYILQAEGARVVIDKSEDGKNAICSPINAADLQLVNAKPGKTVDELAREVIRGLWGNGTDRKNRLTAAGYEYYAVQKRVNELLR